jgi:lysophospholipase L1-like esterase
LSLRYYYTQTHLFDPYLQVPPPSFGPGQLEKPADRYRIIALGGSTTRNPLLAVEHRYPTVLQSLLRAQYGREDLEVFNGGMDWYTSKHSLINYVTNLRDGDPDLVVVMHAVNDMYRSFSPTGFAVGPYHRLWSHFYGPSIYGAKPPSFEQHISSKVVWPSVASVMFSRVRLVERDLPLERFVSRADFERNMRSLLTVLEADGVPVILMTQPFLFKDEMTPEERATLWFGRTFCLSSTESLRSEYPSPRSLAAAMRAYNETVRVLAGEGENVMLLEAESNLAKSLDNFTDDVHYTPAGARRLATAVQEKIGQAGLIDAWLR